MAGIRTLGLEARQDNASALAFYQRQGYRRVAVVAGMYQGARTLRIADGPDEVHKILIAKNVLKQYSDGEGWDFGN